MSEHSIELLGQKFSYPTTWQGTLSVMAVSAAIAFLGYTLDADQIRSYQGLFAGKTEQAYQESLDTVATLNQQIESMQGTILELSAKASLNGEEKKQVYQVLESDRLTRENKLNALSVSQQARTDALLTQAPDLPPREIQKIELQQQSIEQQLKAIQTLQSTQNKVLR